MVAQTINELVERIRLKGDLLPSKRLLEQGAYENRGYGNDLDCKDCHCRSSYDCSPGAYDCKPDYVAVTAPKSGHAKQSDCEDCHNCNDCSECGGGDCTDCNCVDCQRDDC